MTEPTLPLDFAVTDVPPDPLTDEPAIAGEAPPAPTRVYEYACEVCGTELTYGGRGRKPKRCAEHKSGSRSSGKTVTSGTGKWQQPLADALTSQFAMIGLAVYPINAFDGQCILQGAPQLSSSLIGVAETNPKVRDALQKFVTAGAWAGVAAAAAAIAIPILQNHNVIPPLPFNIPGTQAA